MLFRSDRKSTRLNSSHTLISYAVFCLKKKNNTTNPRTYHTGHLVRPHPPRQPACRRALSSLRSIVLLSSFSLRSLLSSRPRSIRPRRGAYPRGVLELGAPPCA